ncbi:peptidoglycan-binding domain-containing protein [Timonella sp. A28]|uniref:peptidoglycan-binding domain-containing protein n=1 Tax=Timonella sp. A28 TaxID=3442640 RepID=UPI003EB85B58
MSSRSNSVKAVIFTAICAATAGAAGAFFLTFNGEYKESPLKTNNADTYPIDVLPYADARKVTVTLKTGSAQNVTVEDDGLVTQFTCAPGGEWEPWESPVVIDGKKKTLLVSETPFYRDLVGGEKGSDVEALQEMLIEQGYAIEKTGYFGQRTRAAMAQLKTDKKIPETKGIVQGSFLRADYLWVSHLPAKISECKTSVGSTISATQVIATLKAEPASAEIPEMSDLIEGQRRLVFDQDEVIFSKNKETKKKLLNEILSFSAVQQAVHMHAEAGDESKPLTVEATYELVTPKDVAPVPPMAIGALQNGQGCVSDGTQTYPVSVLASTLGLTYVEFTDALQPTSILLRAPQDIRCN